MNPEGQRISQVSHTKIGPLALGLLPIAWSENGARLLTEFAGEDESYAVAVSVVTGAEKKLTKNPETGLQGAALSPDGSTVLGTVGLGFGGNQNPKVVTVPWGGGPEKVLVQGVTSLPGAAEPEGLRTPPIIRRARKPVARPLEEGAEPGR